MLVLLYSVTIGDVKNPNADLSDLQHPIVCNSILLMGITLCFVYFCFFRFLFIGIQEANVWMILMCDLAKNFEFFPNSSHCSPFIQHSAIRFCKCVGRRTQWCSVSWSMDHRDQTSTLLISGCLLSDFVALLKLEKLISVSQNDIIKSVFFLEENLVL